MYIKVLLRRSTCQTLECFYSIKFLFEKGIFIQMNANMGLHHDKKINYEVEFGWTLM